MNCQERSDSILLYVADALDPSERRELQDHLATGCVACAAALADAEAVFASIALTLQPQAISPQLRQRILSRIAANPAPPATAPPTIRGSSALPADSLPDSPALRLFRLLVPAAVAAGIAVIITHAVMIRQVRSLQTAQLRAAALQMIVDQREQQIDHLQQQLDRDKPVLALLASPTSGIARLTSKTQPQASAELLWDSASRISVLLTENLSAPPPGKTYELWYITADQRKLPAGTFDVDANGVATLQSAVPPLTVGKLAAAAVTDEPIGGVAAPTGQIQLVGTIQ